MSSHAVATCCCSLFATVLTVLLICTLFLAPPSRGQPVDQQQDQQGDGLLPHDTLRKLALALSARGDNSKAEDRMERKFLFNANVTCNDGSAAGFYIRRNYQSKRWVIFLEGEIPFLSLCTNG